MTLIKTRIVVLGILLSLISIGALFTKYYKIYKISGLSMMDTLSPDSYVIIRKFSTPELVKTSTGQLIAFYFPEGDTVYKLNQELNYYSNVGTKGIKNAKLDTNIYGSLIFKQIKKRNVHIKRCIATPGDTLKLIGNNVYINGMLHPVSNYLHLSDSLLTTKNKTKYAPKQRRYKWTFPHCFDYKWDERYFGPIVIPKKNDIIQLTPFNIPLYKRLIETYEGNSLDIVDSLVYINGEVVDSYKVKQNYYFILGDNLDNSLDSRNWGFLPGNHLIGRVTQTTIGQGYTKYGNVQHIKINR